MMIFSEDIEIARLSPAMIASYSASLLEVEKFRRISYSMTSYLASSLEVGKFRRMAYSITSLVGALSCSPSPTPVCHEAPSAFRVHQPELSGSIFC